MTNVSSQEQIRKDIFQNILGAGEFLKILWTHFGNFQPLPSPKKRNRLCNGAAPCRPPPSPPLVARHHRQGRHLLQEQRVPRAEPRLEAGGEGGVQQVRPRPARRGPAGGGDGERPVGGGVGVGAGVVIGGAPLQPWWRSWGGGRAAIHTGRSHMVYGTAGGRHTVQRRSHAALHHATRVTVATIPTRGTGIETPPVKQRGRRSRSKRGAERRRTPAGDSGRRTTAQGPPSGPSERR